MLLSVLQDQPGAVGKALIPHPAGLSTKPRVRSGKGINSQGGFQVAGALRSVQKHAGNEGWVQHPSSPPCLHHPHPPCAARAGAQGPGEVEHQK